MPACAFINVCTDRENLVLATRYIVQLIFSHTSAPAGSWAARPLRFLLCSEFYKAPRVPASGRGLAEPLPVMLESEKRGRIGAELPGPVILYALQHRIFALSAFAPR